MPIDNEVPDVIKLGKDLEPGDLIRGKRGHHSSGIIYRVNGLQKFYSGELHYEFFSLNDGGSGIYSSRLDPEEEFKVVCGRKEIIRAYDIIELSLLRAAANAVEGRTSLVRVKEMAFNNLNKKLDEMKQSIIKEKLDGQASEGCDVQ